MFQSSTKKGMQMNSCLIESNYETEDLYEDYSSLETEATETEATNVVSFYSEIEPIIKQAINNYFDNKFLHDGKKISKEILDLSYYSSLLFNTTVSDGVNKAYFLMEENNFLNNTIDDSSIGEEIRYMINLISNIHKRVPQEFVGGMILMHLELIEGIEIW